MNQERPKVYTAEFRESSVKLAPESDKQVAQTARDTGINENFWGSRNAGKRNPCST